jgi:DNA helicase MCM8
MENVPSSEPPADGFTPAELESVWRMFWGGEELPPLTEQRVSIMGAFYDALNRPEADELLGGVDWENGESIYFSFRDFRAVIVSACADLCDLDDALREFPDVIVRAASGALTLLRTWRAAAPRCAPRPLRARFVEVVPLDAFVKLDSLSVNRLVSVRGSVMRVSPVRPILSIAAFVCNTCGAETLITLLQGKYEPPASCKSQGCRGQKFNVNHAACVTEDWQQLTLQELDCDSSQGVGPGAGGAGAGTGAAAAADAGRAARSTGTQQLRLARIELRCDLVDRARVGDVVNVIGIVTAIEVDAAAGRGVGRNKLLYADFIDANSIVVTRADEREPAALRAAASALCAGVRGHRGGGAVGAAGSALRFFSPHDLAAVAAIRQHATPAALLIASSVPSIYGLEVVKLGLLLSLMGGTDATVPSRAAAAAAAASQPLPHGHAPTAVPVRATIHVLIVGDPGLGKSQMLRAVSALAPRAVFVTGGFESTSVGLTASVAADRGTSEGGGALNAGALVLADQGVCAIDELDKMPGEHASLLEAMEQQRVTVAKAGAVAWLPARTAVMAAANPTAGRFDRSKTIAENLKISPALLSRFDLTFILLDSHDRQRDEALGSHIVGTSIAASAAARAGAAADDADVIADILASATGGAGAAGTGTAGAGAGSGAGAARVPTLAHGASALATRLAHAASAVPAREIVPASVLRKYLSFARRFCAPVLSPEAALVLRDFYESLRREHGSADDGMPITTRQLESLVRLAEARARLELRDIVTGADATEVCELLRDALWDAAADGLGGLDFGRQGGAGVSDSKRVRNFVALLQKEVRQGRKAWPRAEMHALAAQIAGVAGPRDLLDRAHEQGFLVFSAGLYRLV